MKGFLVFLSTLAIAYAGVRELSQREEQDALDLWRQICPTGREVGTDPNTGATVYCKSAGGTLQENLNHQVNVPGGTGGRQVVFVQPPNQQYNHRIQIQGGSGQGQQAVIYVLPSKASHNVQSEYIPGSTQAQKPTVYYIKGDSSSTSSNDASNVPPPASGYGAPALQRGAPQRNFF